MRDRVRPRITRLLTRTGAALAVTSLMLTIGGGTANAGPQHHGTYPASAPGSNGCAIGAQHIANRPLENDYGQVPGTVEVYYSPSCQTNWLQVTNPVGGRSWKHIKSDGMPDIGAEDDQPTWQMTYTKQVYAPGSTCIDFRVKLYYPDGRLYGQTYSAGSNYLRIC